MPCSAAGDRSANNFAIVRPGPPSTPLFSAAGGARSKGLTDDAFAPADATMRAITVGALGGLEFEDNAAAPIAVRVLLWFVNAAAAGTVDCGCVWSAVTEVVGSPLVVRANEQFVHPRAIFILSSATAELLFQNRCSFHSLASGLCVTNRACQHTPFLSRSQDPQL